MTTEKRKKKTEQVAEAARMAEQQLEGPHGPAGHTTTEKETEMAGYQRTTDRQRRPNIG